MTNEQRAEPVRLKMVVGFMFNEKETDVLLIEKQKPAWQKGKLNGIGGKVELGESFEQAMRREFKEEAGIDHADWKPVFLMHGDDWEVQVFTAKSDEVFYYQQIESEKVLLIEINTLDHYDHVSNLRWIIPMCLDNGSIDYCISNATQSDSSTESSDLKKVVEERIEGEWKATPHSYQIADTGDYDGHWELSNGKVTLFSKEAFEEEEWTPLLNALNELDANFYVDDSAEWAADMFKREWERAQQVVEEQRKEIESFGKRCFYRGFDKATNDDANCFTAWREEAQSLFASLRSQLSQPAPLDSKLKNP